MGLEIILGLQALDPSPSLSVGSRGFLPENAHPNAADNIFVKPYGSTLRSTRFFFIVRLMETPALLVTQRLYRLKIGGAFGGVQAEKETHCGGEYRRQ